MTQTDKAGPAHADTDAATGSRWYIHPLTGERFISVTTALSVLEKPGLPSWYAKLTATAAIDRIDWLTGAALVDTCNQAGDDACGMCRTCAIAWLTRRGDDTRDHAADIGSRVHAAAEQEALFGPGAHIDDDIKPYVEQYQRWMRYYRPQYEATEMTVLSRRHGYGGTLDGILRFPGDSPLPKHLWHLLELPLIKDTKTGKNVGITHGWQLNAYAAADAVLLPDGSEMPMPAVEGGLLLHLRPDKVQMREVQIGERHLARFLAALDISQGLTSGLNSILSRPVTMPQEA